MLEKVKNTIAKYNQLDEKDKVLVALSGGADSVCLCLVLKELGYCVGAAHVNHNIREEAYEDALFAEAFCKQNDISFHLHNADVKNIAAEEKISEEVAGRKVRYEFFRSVADEFCYDKIAVAHNMDDNAETVLLNLARGTGSKGLCAIPEKRGNIVRPLLKVSRAEIEQYLKNKNQDFVTDKTNLECNYNRNKIRNLIIPKLVEVNEAFVENVSRTSDIISAENDFLEQCASELVKKENEITYITKKDFFNAHIAIKARALSMAYEIAAGTGKDFEKKHIDYIVENVKENSQGNIIELPFNTICFAEYDKICFSAKKEKNSFTFQIKPDETVEIECADMIVSVKYVDINEVKFGENREYFDITTDKITLRSFCEGDKIVPLGKNTPKKLKEIFINKKIPVRERNTKIIAECDEILCVLGVCRSNNFKITENTKKVLMIKGEKKC